MNELKAKSEKLKAEVIGMLRFKAENLCDARLR
jgi:hypothetical protein